MHREGANATDWALLVLPVIEGAIQFQMAGAIATWLGIAAGYACWAIPHDMPPADAFAERLAIVLLVGSPSSFLAESLFRRGRRAPARGRDEAERRGSLSRAAALDGRKKHDTLDVDEILEVLRSTVTEMGFTDPQVFELVGEAPYGLRGLPVRQSRLAVGDEPGEQKLAAAKAPGKPVDA